MHSFNRGITLVEILLIVGLIALVGSTSGPLFSHFILRNNTDSAQNIIVNTIHKAQNYSMNYKNSSLWGVCLISGNIRLFTGSCASPLVHEDTAVPAGITINGLATVTFSKQRGEPSSPLTVTVVSDLKTKTIQLNSAGGMDIN